MKLVSDFSQKDLKLDPQPKVDNFLFIFQKVFIFISFLKSNKMLVLKAAREHNFIIFSSLHVLNYLKSAQNIQCDKLLKSIKCFLNAEHIKIT